MKPVNLVGILLLAGTMMLLCLVTGCTGIPSFPPAMKGGGVTEITPEDTQHPVSFDDAYHSVLSSDQGNNTTFYYIWGDAVNSQGLAKDWIFGIKRGQEQSFAIYNSKGLSFIPWNGNNIYAVIPVDHIIKPADLIKDHRVVIQEVQNPDIDKMELVNGIYTLSSTMGPEGRTFMFNELTGNMVQ